MIWQLIFLASGHIPLSGCIFTVCLTIQLPKNTLVVSKSWWLWMKLLKPPCACFCVDRIFLSRCFCFHSVDFQRKVIFTDEKTVWQTSIPCSTRIHERDWAWDSRPTKPPRQKEVLGHCGGSPHPGSRGKKPDFDSALTLVCCWMRMAVPLSFNFLP